MPTVGIQTVSVDLPHGRAYSVHFDGLKAASQLFESVGLRRGEVLVITDKNVAALYVDQLQETLERQGWFVRACAIEPGEASKSADVLERLYDWALERPIDRQTPVVALGGGVVGDVAGYLAATLLRGLPLVQFPTSLIAQVDSSIGGKTGINHAAGKNLVGAFHQPRLVLIDASTLSTLPEREFGSGLSEVIKHALITDAEFFDWLEASWDNILQKTEDTAAEMVRRAASIKAAIVAKDERESGERILLNFGHTFGHAIERASGYGTFTHGEAVALGMRAALHLSSSVVHGAAYPEDAILPNFSRADALVSRVPIARSLKDLDGSTLMESMQTDKKRSAADLRFVVLDAIGQARLVSDVPSGAVEAAWAYALHVNQG